jgi:hypothetical protein
MRGTHALTLQHLMSSFGGPQTVEGRKAPRQRPAESYLKYVAGRADGGQRSRWAVIRDPHMKKILQMKRNGCIIAS